MIFPPLCDDLRRLVPSVFGWHELGCVNEFFLRSILLPVGFISQLTSQVWKYTKMSHSCPEERPCSDETCVVAHAIGSQSHLHCVA